jgi:hypothetical protein
MRIGLRTSAALLLVATAVGCTKSHAKTPPTYAGLETPAPPDRVVTPVTLPEPAEPTPTPAAPVQPPPPRPRESPPPRSAPVTPAPSSPPAGPEQPPAPPPVLQTTTNPAQVAQRARALIASAQRDLDRIKPAQLTPNALAQYDSARGFIRQAEDALKASNVVLARDLADKAAALASQLGR